jgi:hypothetical protein
MTKAPVDMTGALSLFSVAAGAIRRADPSAAVR